MLERIGNILPVEGKNAEKKQTIADESRRLQTIADKSRGLQMIAAKSRRLQTGADDYRQKAKDCRRVHTNVFSCCYRLRISSLTLWDSALQAAPPTPRAASSPTSINSWGVTSMLMVPRTLPTAPGLPKSEKSCHLFSASSAPSSQHWFTIWGGEWLKIR